MDEPESIPASLDFLAPMLESLDTGFAAVDAQGRFQFWNQANTRILGMPADFTVSPEEWSKHYGLHCPDTHRLLEHHELPLVTALRDQVRVEREIVVVNPALPKGRWIKVVARPLYGPEKELIGGMATTHDITREKASGLASQMMSWFFSASDDAILSVNLEGTILLWNPGAERLFGWKPDEIIGKAAYLLVPGDRRHEIDTLLERAKKSEPLPAAEGVALHKSGRDVLISRSITPIHDKAQRIVGAVISARDISRVKRAEEQLESSREQLRLLSSRQQHLLEQQLLGVARELHDEIGQQLAAMKFEVAWLERHLDSKPDVDERLSSLNQCLDLTITSLRRVARQMRPPLLEELGLCHAVEELLSSIEGRYPMQTSFHCDCRHLHYLPDAALTIYRIIQEALTNVIKHAHAEKVSVIISFQDQNLLITVADDGRGLPEVGPTRGTNFGILGMQERAHTWSGHVEVRSGSGGPGTRVRATFHGPRVLADTNESSGS